VERMASLRSATIANCRDYIAASIERTPLNKRSVTISPFIVRLKPP